MKTQSIGALGARSNRFGYSLASPAQNYLAWIHQFWTWYSNWKPWRR